MMISTSIQRLEREANALDMTVRTAAKNPFLPAAARDGIAQAAYVIRELVAEVKRLSAALEAREHNDRALNAELRELRRSSGFAVTTTAPAELELRGARA